MKRLSSPRILAAAALSAAALGTATVAEARPDIYFSVGFQSGPTWVEPAPVYVQPRRVYVEPQPVYVQPRPVYVQPRYVHVEPRRTYVRPPVYDYDRPWGQSYGAAHADERAWHRSDAKRHWKKRHHGWDRHDERDCD